MALSWNDLSEKLAEPFSAAAVYWRAGSVSRDKKRAQALPYAEPRVYEDRLNALCPGLWSVSFRPWGETRIICELTLGAQDESGSLSFSTRASTGEEGEGGFAPGTAAEAQAFKRACSKFGLGRYLYDVPINWVDYDETTRRLAQTPTLPARFTATAENSPRGNQAETVVQVDADVKQAATRSRKRTSAPAGSEGLKTRHEANARLLPPPAATETHTEASATPVLSAKRAEAMHRELEKLGLPRAEQHALASSVLDREVAGFADLSESEALLVWNVAKRSQTPHHAVGF